MEGETDRYFFQSILDLKRPDLKQDITVLDISGKGNYSKWKAFLDSFGMQNYFICDLDNIDDFGILTETEYKEIIQNCKKDILKNIDEDCLKKGNSRDAIKLLSSLENIISRKPPSITEEEQNDLYSLFNYMLENRLPSNSLNNYINSQPILKQKINTGILSKYNEGIFILQNGSLETYIGKSKSLQNTIDFCNQDLKSFIENTADGRSIEINKIIQEIVK